MRWGGIADAARREPGRGPSVRHADAALKLVGDGGAVLLCGNNACESFNHAAGAGGQI